jgi:tetratricopeptide (TPR) repeat protein
MTDDSQHLIRVPGSDNGKPTAFTFEEVAEEMEALFERQLKERDGDLMETVSTMVSFYGRFGRPEQAIQRIKELLEELDNPEERASIFFSLGQLSEGANDYESAASFYRSAHEMGRFDDFYWYFIHNNLGYSLNQLEMPEDAEEYLRVAIEVDPGRCNAFKNLGLSHYLREQYAEAAICFVDATAVNPRDGRSFHHLSQLLQEHPEVLEEIPHLAEDLESCRQAVKTVNFGNSDFESIWRDLRARQSN